MAKRERYQNRIELLQGTLDLLVLQTLQWGPQHGYGIAQAIQAGSSDVLQVDTGSLYPALHRLERQKWIAATWKLSANKQRTRVYRLTAAGRRQLASERSRWETLVGAMTGILAKTGRKVDMRDRDAELREELETHLKMAAADRVERGQDPRDAAAAARREMGNISRSRKRPATSGAAAGSSRRRRTCATRCAVPPQPGLRARRHPLAHARHRRQHRAVRGRQRGASAHAARRRPGRARRDAHRRP